MLENNILILAMCYDLIRTAPEPRGSQELFNNVKIRNY